MYDIGVWKYYFLECVLLLKEATIVFLTGAKVICSAPGGLGHGGY